MTEHEQSDGCNSIFSEFLGKRIRIYFLMEDGRLFKYTGKILKIHNAKILFDDEIDGALLLAEENIKTVEIVGDSR